MNIDQNTSYHLGKIKRIIKILVVGDAGTGKTSLIRQYVQSYFSEFYKLTIGVDFATKDIDYEENTTVSLQLWDIAGQEFGGEMTHVYFKEASAAFVVFDLLRPLTFDNASKWKKDIDDKVLTSEKKPIPCVLLGNKIDLCNNGEWFKTKEQMDQYIIDKSFIRFFETSARNGTNIENASNFLVKYIMNNHIEPYIDNVLEPIPENKKSCCH